MLIGTFQSFSRLACTGLAVGALIALSSAAQAAKNENNNPTNRELFIEEVIITFDDTNVSCPNAPVDTITIRGTNFDNGDPPTVTLGQQGPITICSVSGTEIVAELPNSLTDGDYRVAVSTGPAVTDYSEYDLTVGAVGGGGPSLTSVFICLSDQPTSNSGVACGTFTYCALVRHDAATTGSCTVFPAAAFTQGFITVPTVWFLVNTNGGISCIATVFEPSSRSPEGRRSMAEAAPPGSRGGARWFEHSQ